MEAQENSSGLKIFQTLPQDLGKGYGKSYVRRSRKRPISQAKAECGTSVWDRQTGNGVQAGFTSQIGKNKLGMAVGSVRLQLEKVGGIEGVDGKDAKISAF